MVAAVDAGKGVAMTTTELKAKTNETLADANRAWMSVKDDPTNDNIEQFDAIWAQLQTFIKTSVSPGQSTQN